jgi:hypothetical protein
VSSRARGSQPLATLVGALLFALVADADEGPRRDFERRCAAQCTGSGLTVQQCAGYCDCLSADAARYVPASDWPDLASALEGEDAAPGREKARLGKSRERCEATLRSGY